MAGANGQGVHALSIQLEKGRAGRVRGRASEGGTGLHGGVVIVSVGSAAWV